jgi:hypothetical protein
MGSYTDAKIEAWQKEAGIEPAREARTLRAISDKAFELIKVIELECSGIRDGDGYWHGGDVMGHMMRDMIKLCQQYMDASNQDYEKAVERWEKAVGPVESEF